MPIIVPKVSAYLLPSPTPVPPPPPLSNLSQQPQPRGASGRGGVSYTSGSGEVATVSYLTGQSDGPVSALGQQLDAYARATITTPRSPGTPLPQFASSTVSRRSEMNGLADDTVTVSLWVRYSGLAYNIGARLVVIVFDGSSVVTRLEGDRVTIGNRTGGDWLRIHTSAVAAGSYTHIGWEVVFDGPSAAAGSTIDVTGVLIEKGALGPYFDGSTPDFEWDGFIYQSEWFAAPWYSSSSSVPAPAPAPLPDPLSVISAKVALDRRWVPYAQAQVEVADNVASSANPARSDPPRLVLDVIIAVEYSLQLAHLTAAYFGQTLAALSAHYAGRTLADITTDYSTPYNPDDGTAGATERRVFNLGVREAEWSSSAASTRIVAASDEALAQDYRLVRLSPTEVYGPVHNPADGDSIVTQVLGRLGMAFAGFYGPNGRPSHAGVPDVPLEDRVWEPGQSAWDFLSGAMTPGGWRLWCDETRLWAAEHTTVASRQRRPRTHRVYPTTSIVRRTREVEGWADAIVALFQWTDAGGTRRERYLTAAATTSPTKVRYVTYSRQPSQALVDRLLRSALNSDSYAETELDAPPLIGVTPGDTLDLGDYALTALAVEWNFPDNTMKVKA